MYNVLEKLRAGAELSAKERTIHEQGLVSLLKQIHDDLDAAVFAAYGWPATLTDEEILERLVALNAERAAEEARGIVRWLRPEFQNPAGDGKQQQPLDLVVDESEDTAQGDGSRFRAKTKSKSATKAGNDSRPPRRGPALGAAPQTTVVREWPKSREAQAKAVLAALKDADRSVTAAELAAMFAKSKSSGSRAETIGELLEALATLGHVRRLRGGRLTIG